jgi:ABC-2 type transport system permease protein/lipopolysaccharide transport system permease protein
MQEVRVPPVELRYRRRLGVRRAAAELWSSRELIRTLAEREYRVRYKQAAIGFAWAFLTPLALMAVFTIFFQHVAKVEQSGPYPIFAYLGLLPWTFFSTSLQQGGLSLVLNVPLLNKVYCPREVFPIASCVVAGLDTLIATTGLFVLFAIYQTAPAATSVWVPVLMCVQIAFTVGLTLLFSIVMVYLRDLRYALPIFLQLALFATPVAYGLDAIPSSLRPIYCALNPMAAVIDGYRRTVLEGVAPDWQLVGISAVTAFSLLLFGYFVFKRLETGVADVA